MRAAHLHHAADADRGRRLSAGANGTSAETPAITARRAATAATAEAAITALFAILLAHLDAGLGLVLFDANGQKANDVGIDTHAPLHLGHRCGRRVDVEEGVVGLAILLDLESEVLQSPVFLLGDFALAFFDDVLKFFHQGFDLSLGHVLACQERMLVKRHTMAFRFELSRSWNAVVSLRRKAPIRPEKGRSGTHQEKTLGDDVRNASRQHLIANAT